MIKNHRVQFNLLFNGFPLFFEFKLKLIKLSYFIHTFVIMSSKVPSSSTKPERRSKLKDLLKISSTVVLDPVKEEKNDRPETEKKVKIKEPESVDEVSTDRVSTDRVPTEKREVIEEEVNKSSSDEDEEESDVFKDITMEELMEEIKGGENTIYMFYHIDGYYKFIEFTSNTSGEKMMIYIPSRFELPINPVYIPSIELSFVDMEKIEEDNERTGSRGLKRYTEVSKLDTIKNLGRKTDDLETDYKEINIKNKGEVNRGLSVLFSQMGRLKLCVNKLNYKLVIKYSPTTKRRFLVVINRSNDVDVYEYSSSKHSGGTANSEGEESTKKQMMIVTDVETYYKNIDEVWTASRKILSSVFSILRKVHLSSFLELKNKMDSFSTRIDKESIKYKGRGRYNSVLRIARDKIRVLEEKNKRLLEKEKQERKHIRDEVKLAFVVDKINRERIKIQMDKDRLFKLCEDIMGNYNEILLKYDTVLFENITLLDRIKENMDLM